MKYIEKLLRISNIYQITSKIYILAFFDIGKNFMSI